MSEIRTHEEIIKFAKELQAHAALVIESGEEHVPVMFILSEDNQINVCGFDLNNAMKETWQLAIPELLRQFNCRAYISINEVWMAKMEPDSPYSEKLQSGEITVSQLPPDDRKEQVMMMIVEKNQPPQTWFAEICYKSNKRFIKKWEEIPQPDQLTGRMIVTEW